MSRRQIAPGRWELEPPATPRRPSRPYAAVPAEVVGAMRPILTHGGNYLEAHTGNRPKALTVVRR